MKIQKINNNKVRVIFDYKELEENHISVHSFLSNSEDTKRLVTAIINIVKEDLSFSADAEELTYDTISFCNKVFIIVITRTTDKKGSYIEPNNILYKFENINEITNFLKSIKNYTHLDNLSLQLYQLRENFYIKINLQTKESLWKKSFISILSEFASPIYLNSISEAYFCENAKLITDVKY